MKQYDCTSEDLMNMAEQCEEGSYTQRKLLDIYALFSDYEQQISGPIHRLGRLYKLIYR